MALQIISQDWCTEKLVFSQSFQRCKIKSKIGMNGNEVPTCVGSWIFINDIPTASKNYKVTQITQQSAFGDRTESQWPKYLHSVTL